MATTKRTKVNIEFQLVRAELKAPWTAVRRFVLTHLSQVTLIEPERRQKQLREELYVALSLYPQR